MASEALLTLLRKLALWRLRPSVGFALEGKVRTSPLKRAFVAKPA
jgi:hypothetical protein